MPKRQVEMPRKYAVLKQFTQDLDRLLREAEAGFAVLRARENPTQAEILAVYRPVHSLKGICGMVEETKLLVRAFHALEETLPPLVPVRAVKAKGKSAEKSDWTSIAAATFQMAREVERILVAKLELWRKLGADDNESRGLLVSFVENGTEVRAWIAITNLLGLVDAAEIRDEVVVGTPRSEAPEALLVETSEGPVAVRFEAILSTCTRLESVQQGVPMAFKDWWIAYRKSQAA